MHATACREDRHAGSRSVSPFGIPWHALAGGADRLKVCFAIGLLALACTGCGSQSLKNVVERDLLSKDGLACRGYLGWNGPDVQHVFLWMNGTGVYSSAFIHPSVEDALKVNPAAYLTFDKLGIRAPFGDPAKLLVNHDELKRYTQG